MVAKACNVYTYPISYFYPISYRNASKLYEKNSPLLSNSSTTFVDTYLIHFWGKMSNHLQINENSVFEFYAQKHCPVMFKKYSLNRTGEFVKEFSIPL